MPPKEYSNVPVTITPQVEICQLPDKELKKNCSMEAQWTSEKCRKYLTKSEQQ